MNPARSGAVAGWRVLFLASAVLVVAQVGNPAPLVTRWASDVRSDTVWPEYPRPQLVRERWLNLNGLWDYAVTPSDQPEPAAYDGTILVPFPIESHLSGVGRRFGEQECLWYRREITVPSDWRGQRIQLHFGAVDWETTVFLNDRPLGVHRGGYDAFTFDITPALRWGEPNELVVRVTDPTEGDQPRGKQSRRPEGIFYLPSSGIWQTVWIEPVPPAGIRGLYLAPNLEAGQVEVRVMADATEEVSVDCVARFRGERVGEARGGAGATLVLPLQQVNPWSPERPDLYDLEVILRQDGREVDRVTSYFGLRDIRVQADAAGRQRLFLNGQPLFQMGVLDQGFWPDGLYTAPTDEALRSDLEMAKRLGFNLVRKHVKVEPARWYYWADRLGLLVWQDMPSGNNASPEGRRWFESELHRMMDQLMNHPSIVMWVLFNEGWGQFDTERLVRGMQLADPTRLVNNASGWTDATVGDVIDLHSYPEPIAPAPELARATVLGEYGGLGLAVAGHKWSEDTWGYQGMADSATLTRAYGALVERVWELHDSSSLSAAVYTQLTDVETECNGFLTYDRAVLKMDALAVHLVNRNHSQPDAGLMPLPNALAGRFLWRYTTTLPADDWVEPGFDDAAWAEGMGGFGTEQTPGARLHTTWNTPDIWLRRGFELPTELPRELSLSIHHDEDVEIYLNGVRAAALEGFTTGYRLVEISPAARAALRPGQNVVAVHCRQQSGGQYIDVGLVSIRATFP